MSNRTQNWAATIGALAAVIGVLLALGVIKPFGASVESAVVPLVIGLDRAFAVAQLESVGFEVEEEAVASADVMAGRVVSTAPVGGTTAEKGSVVRVFVSGVLPAEPIPPPEPPSNGIVSPTGIILRMPDLSHLTKAEAAAQLDALGLDVAAVVFEASGSVPEGAVIRTEPPVGAVVLRGNAVRLVVSSGEPDGPEQRIDIALSLDPSTCPIVPGGGLSGRDVLTFFFGVSSVGDTSYEASVQATARSDTGLEGQSSTSVPSDSASTVQVELTPQDYAQTHIFTIAVEPTEDLDRDAHNNQATITVLLPAAPPSEAIDPCRA